MVPLRFPRDEPILKSMARVLIVDDDEITRLILGRMMEDAGHQVTYACDGEQALGVVRAGRFDLVMTDLAMPERNGLRLIQDLREEDDRLPVIAMSGINAEQLILAEDLGAKQILYKPLEPEVVLAAVDTALADETDEVWDFAWG